jgi:hypothetical protein
MLSPKHHKILFCGMTVIFLALAVSWPQHIKTILGSGGSIKIHAASILQPFSATCAIHLESKSGMSAETDLVQGWLDGPLIVVPSPDENIFYCVYDHDTDFQLLRIDLKAPFVPPARNTSLGDAILSSTCAVHRVKPGETNDWNAAAAA